jgi:hypothetical protein
MRPMTWEELVSAPIPKTIINEPIEPEGETAAQKAQRLWFDRREQSEEGTWRGANLAKARQ